jgi:glycosidase
MVAQYNIPSPSWAKDLVIYELNPKGFTSPQGQATGTFNSVKEKIPYLEELGINAVWFTGHSWGDHQHFYNIWTQYACIRPDSLDSTLGTPKEFKAMIDDFHQHGIKVFLDIITHGVIRYSPLVMEHPEWFKGSTWGMADYDWFGGHKDLDDWWVRIHTDYVTKYGIDGFRLDVNIYRPDLWHKIKENAINAGHPVIVFDENVQFCEEVADFYQTSVKLSNQKLRDRLLDNVAAFYTRFVRENQEFNINNVVVNYTDNTKESKPSFTVVTTDPLNTQIKISHIDPAKSVKNILVSISGKIPNAKSQSYQIEGVRSNGILPLSITGSEITVNFTPAVPAKYYQSVQLSSHDEGWNGFPEADNPYVAEGSRCLFGYSFLFLPSIPIFMAGEEFDADHVPLPALSPYLYKKEKIGQGKWLYGSWIQWDQLKEKRHADMLVDVKKMIAIRKQESDLIHAVQNDVLPAIDSLVFSASAKVPVPYILWGDKSALIIAGNPTDKDVKITVNIPLNKIGMQDAKKVIITDLWNGGEKKWTPDSLKSFSFIVKKDRTAAGGISIFKIKTYE